MRSSTKWRRQAVQQQGERHAVLPLRLCLRVRLVAKAELRRFHRNGHAAAVVRTTCDERGSLTRTSGSSQAADAERAAL